MTIEQLRALLAAGLAAATDAELATALQFISSTASSYAGQTPTSESVETLRELAQARDAITAEQSNRAALAQQQADLLAGFTAADDDDADADGDDGAADDDDADADADDDGADADDADGDDADGDGRQGLAGRRIPLGSMTRGRRGGNRQLADIVVGGRARFATTVTTDGHGTVQADAEVTDRDAFLDAFAVKARSYYSARNPLPKQSIIRVDKSYPDERQLSPERTDNSRRIRRAQRQAQQRSMKRRTAAFAAGGLCAPADVRYEIPVIGDVARPVRDALLPMQAEHGRIQFRPAINGAQQGGATGFWTVQDDIDAATAGAPDPTKTCLAVDCPATATCQIEAVYHCVELPNMTARFDPDWAESAVEATYVGHARAAENRLLAALRAGSTLLTSAKVLGASRDVLMTIDRMVAMIRSVFRMDPEVEPLRMVAPAWLNDMIRADLVAAQHTSRPEWLATPTTEVNNWLGAAGRNVNPTWHLDGLGAVVGPPAVAQQFYDPVVAGTAVPEFPDTVEVFLYGEGDWLLLDGGTLDIGVVRDSALNSRNRYQQFAETFEAACYAGPTGTTPRSFRLFLTLDPTGLSAGTVAAGATE